MKLKRIKHKKGSPRFLRMSRSWEIGRFWDQQNEQVVWTRFMGVVHINTRDVFGGMSLNVKKARLLRELLGDWLTEQLKRGLPPPLDQC